MAGLYWPGRLSMADTGSSWGTKCWWAAVSALWKGAGVWRRGLVRPLFTCMWRGWALGPTALPLRSRDTAASGDGKGAALKFPCQGPKLDGSSSSAPDRVFTGALQSLPRLVPGKAHQALNFSKALWRRLAPQGEIWRGRVQKRQAAQPGGFLGKGQGLLQHIQGGFCP